MEKRGRLRYLVPILVIIVIALVQPTLPQASLAAFIERQAGDYSFRELRHLLPEGIESIVTSTPWETGAMLVARTDTDGLVLAKYNAAEGKLESGLQALPPNYATPESVARSGDYLLFGGESLGTSPVLGLYDASSQQVDDVSDVLPADVERIALIVGGDQSFLTVTQNGTGYTPGIFESGSRNWRSLDVGTFANLASVAHGTWNGTTFYVVGAKAGGVPALLQVAPAGGVVDLSDDLPDDMEEANYLVWTGASLYLLGWRHSLITSRASMAFYVPRTGVTTSLSSALRSDYTSLRSGVWNGTALIFVAEIDATQTLMAYYPAEETSLHVDDVLPPGRNYRDMVRYGESILLTGGDGTPLISQLDLSDWSWEEKEEAFEGHFQAIYHAQVAGDAFVVAGVRHSSAALAFVEPAVGSLEDRSEALDLVDTTILGTAGEKDYLLIAGQNDTGGVLYGYGFSNGSLKDLTPNVPLGVEFSSHPSRVGDLYSVPGSRDGESVLLVYDRGADRTMDLGAQVQRYFDPPIGLAAGSDNFLIFGHNDKGPALALLNGATLNVTFLGRDVARLYGPSGFILSAAWSGETFLIGGTLDGRPLLGAWNPASDTYSDLSRQIPDDFGIITTIAWMEDGFAVGGQGLGRASVGAYYPRNGSFVDLRGMLPLSYAGVNSLAARGSEVLMVSTLTSSGISIGVLRLGTSSALLGGLPAVISEPTGAIVLGLSVTLAAVVAYVIGRRTRPRKVPNMPLPPPYPEVPFGPPEEYAQSYPEEFETIPHWYDW